MTATEPGAGLRDAIVVPGIGRVSVEPDVATVRLGVMVTRPTAGAAREEAAATMTAVLGAIAAAGVERRDVGPRWSRCTRSWSTARTGIRE